MRVGIPRGLNGYYHYPLWRRFLTGLGADVVLSPFTDRAILNAGIKLAPPEICLPVKAYLGHVAWLKDRCDALMIPRVVCVRQGRKLRFGCPKSLCLPDLVRASIAGLPGILELNIDERLGSSSRSYSDLARLIGNHQAVRPAFRQATTEQADFDAALRNGLDFSAIWTWDSGSPAACDKSPELGSGSTRIGVIGHPYLLFDPGLSLNLPDKLAGIGVETLYSVALPDRAVFYEPSRQREICWLYEQDLLRGAGYFLTEVKVDGLLLVSSFSCGTSAVVNEVIYRELRHTGIPMSTILLDEHTGEAGTSTRLEAFVDMVRHRRRSARALQLPPSRSAPITQHQAPRT